MYTMLHTKFQGHQSVGSGGEDFLRFLPYMGMAAILVIRPKPVEQLFVPKGLGGCIRNLVTIGPVVSECQPHNQGLQYFANRIFH